MMISPIHDMIKVMPDLFEPVLLIPDFPFRVPYGESYLAVGTFHPRFQVMGLDREVP
jgi:hypothetical protein